MPIEKSNETDPLPPPEEESEARETHDLFISAEPAEKQEAADADIAADLADEQHFKTKDSDGHTYNPHQASEQGLTYTPPSDPPTLPSEDDPQGAEMAAGFAPSMEASDPDVERLPDRVDDNDLDLRDDVYTALRLNSETFHLTRVKVQVDQGVINLLGTVPTEDDINRIYDIVRGLNGVVAIKNNLQTWMR
jgi:osmotically-inducible protein OsmY